jgi:hypothetical protein
MKYHLRLWWQSSCCSAAFPLTSSLRICNCTQHRLFLRCSQPAEHTTTSETASCQQLLRCANLMQTFCAINAVVIPVCVALSVENNATSTSSHLSSSRDCSKAASCCARSAVCPALTAATLASALLVPSLTAAAKLSVRDQAAAAAAAAAGLLLAAGAAAVALAREKVSNRAAGEVSAAARSGFAELVAGLIGLSFFLFNSASTSAACALALCCCLRYGSSPANTCL